MNRLQAEFSRAFEVSDKTAAAFARAHAAIEDAASRLEAADPARRAGTVARQSGRTARHLAYLLDLAAAGQKIVFLSHTPEMARYAHQMAADLAGRQAKVFSRQVTVGSGGIWFRCFQDAPHCTVLGLVRGLDRLALDHAADLDSPAAERWLPYFKYFGIPRA